MQGWSPDFIPKLTGDAIDGGLVDAHPAGQRRRRAAAGARTGAARKASSAASRPARRWPRRLRSRKTAPKGSRILFMVPDTGERYLSTPLFEDDRAGDGRRGTGDLELDAAVPLRRDRRPAGSRAGQAAEPRRPARAISSSEAIADPEQPVVMFALEWCEFCWAVRRFLADIGVPFRSVDLDSVAMQADGLGGDIRKDLHARTGEATIPQIFIGGVHVGGAVDVLASHDRGELEPLLRKAGVRADRRQTLVGAELSAQMAGVPICRLSTGGGSRNAISAGIGMNGRASLDARRSFRRATR